MNPRQKPLSLVLIVFLIVPLLVGCYDRIELEGMAFVVSIGLDKGPQDTIDMTARIAIPGEMSGGGGDSAQQNAQGSKPITVRAETFSEAITMLNATVERRVSLLHLTSVLIGSSISQEGLLEHLRPLVRSREVRRTLNIIFTKGDAREVFMSNDPVIERSVTRWQESIYEVGRYTGLNATKKLHEFIVALETPLEDPYGPVMTLNEDVKKQKEASRGGNTVGEQSLGNRKPTFKAGDLPRLGGNNLDMIGAAVFKNDKLAAYLDGLDARMLLMVRGELSRTQMDFPDPLVKGNYVAVELKHARAPEIEVDYAKKPVQVRILQKLEGDLIGSPGNVDYTNPEKMQTLEQKVSGHLKDRQVKLIKHLFHEHQTDPFGIFKKSRHKFATVQGLNEIDYRKMLEDAEVSMTVDLQIRRFGVQMAPVTGR